jgi:hypothetical protein
MGILWRGGEDIDFPNGTAVVVDTTAGHFRAGYARCALRQSVLNAISRSTPFPGGAVTSFWATARIAIGVLVAGYPDTRMFGIGRSGGTGAIWVGADTTTTGTLALYASNGTRLAVADSPSFGAYSGFRLDLHIANFGDDASIDVYQDGALILSWTGDIATLTGVSDLDSVVFGRTAVTDTPAVYLSEIIVSTADTRLFSLVTLFSNAAGDANTFTAGAHTDIDEVAKNDADTAYSDTPGQGLLVGLSDLPEGDFIVKDLAVVARLSDGVGGMGMKLGVKTNGAVHLGDTITLEGAWATKVQQFALNPETDNMFTPTEINALQLAFESEAA